MSAGVAITLWRCLAAGAISVAVGALLYAMLAVAARRWPALAARRGPWLLAQAAVVAAFALALLPSALPWPGGSLITVRADALALAPADEAMTMAIAHADATAAINDGADAAKRNDAVPTASIATLASASESASTTPSRLPVIDVPVSALRHDAKAPRIAASLLPWLGFGALLVYAAGLLWRGARGVRHHLRWRALLATARELDMPALRAHGAFSASQLARMRARSLVVLETTAPLSPMLIGALRPRLVLPASLRGFSDTQQALIIAHELTHWRRRDTLWLAVSGALQTLFWFNLPLRWLGRRLHWAVELGCDGAVLTGRTQQERHSYAAALVAQLRQQHSVHPGVPAFGALAVRERIERMRHTVMPRLPVFGALTLAVAGGAIVIGGVLLQPAFASRGDAGAPPATAQSRAPIVASKAPSIATSIPATTAAPSIDHPALAWRYPLDHVLVSSLYGVVSARLPAGHHGIDFRAKRGTPVLAVAAGTVIASAFDADYGNYIRIDHGNGRQSLAIHLDSSAVRIGDTVRAGQRIGAVGATGNASGPHLHLEYWRDGQRQDPALMFADLDQRATAPALARRAAQQPRAG